jgi:hypothetical protein
MATWVMDAPKGAKPSMARFCLLPLHADVLLSGVVAAAAASAAASGGVAAAAAFQRLQRPWVVT